jgi:hypothetical protein
LNQKGSSTHKTKICFSILKDSTNQTTDDLFEGFGAVRRLPTKGAKQIPSPEDTLTKDRNFMALWDENFETPEEQQCATRILEAWDDTNVCPKCMQPMESGHKCDKNDAPIYNHLDYVRQAIGRSLLLRSIKEAHQKQPSTDKNTSPITMGEKNLPLQKGNTPLRRTRTGYPLNKP